jgi:hypothetical protein
VDYLCIDEYTRVDRGCPVKVDLHPADDVVEITLGEHRIGGSTVRLLIDDPDTCLRLADSLRGAQHQLIAHLRTKSTQDPATPPSGETSSTPTAG